MKTMNELRFRKKRRMNELFSCYSCAFLTLNLLTLALRTVEASESILLLQSV